MSLRKSSGTTSNYMSGRSSYKRGSSKYTRKSGLEHRKEYNEKLAERARKAAEEEAERVKNVASTLQNQLNSASNEFEIFLTRLSSQAMRAWAIEKDGFEVTEWNTDANGRLIPKKYAEGKGPQDNNTGNISGVTMNGANSLLYSANSNEARYQSLITKYAQQYNLDPNMVAAIITIESSWNPNAVSSANCQGLMQVNPKYNEGNLYDVETNISNGCRIFRECLNACNGDVAHALVSYNMGITGAKNTPTSSYSNKVLAEYNRRTGLAQNNPTGSQLNVNA